MEVTVYVVRRAEDGAFMAQAQDRTVADWIAAHQRAAGFHCFVATEQETVAATVHRELGRIYDEYEAELDAAEAADREAVRRQKGRQ